MNIKVILHIMPWEIDYALLTFDKLKRSYPYLDKKDNVYIETVLNVSSYLINWEDSVLPKEFYIEKYNQISHLLSDYNHIKRIYKGDKLYGHLDLQRECIAPEIDYYMGICPDMYFHEQLLAEIIGGAKQIPNKYFVITPQISKLWDATWDVLVNPSYQNIPYQQWDSVDTYQIALNDKLSTQLTLTPIDQSKYAGWFDLYNKAFYEDLVPVQEDWNGYGSWDWYTLIVSHTFKQKGGDFQQYVLEGRTIFEYPVGNLKENGFHSYYKNNITLNDIPDQRDIFKAKVMNYAQQRISEL